MVVKLTEDYGEANDVNSVSDLVIADFELLNVTDTASVTITGVTYNATTNEHTLQYASQDLTDVLSIEVVKAGLSSAVETDVVA